MRFQKSYSRNSNDWELKEINGRHVLTAKEGQGMALRVKNVATLLAFHKALTAAALGKALCETVHSSYNRSDAISALDKMISARLVIGSGKGLDRKYRLTAAGIKFAS